MLEKKVMLAKTRSVAVFPVQICEVTLCPRDRLSSCCSARHALETVEISKLININEITLTGR